jgi:hypothetical protein
MTPAHPPGPPERTRYLVLAAVSPTIWLLHFLLSYITASVWCARIAGTGGALGTVHMWVAAYTVVALAGIALVGWGGHRRRDHGAAIPPHDDDTPEDRRRFLGHTAVLLSGLSAVATIYSAIAVFMFDVC